MSRERIPRESAGLAPQLGAALLVAIALTGEFRGTLLGNRAAGRRLRI